MAIVHSTTKGLAAMVMALAQSRGWLDYDQLVSTYWPEFAQRGKERITVRQLLSHQAGCSPSTRRSTARWSRTSIDSRRSWPSSDRHGNRGSDRLTIAAMNPRSVLHRSLVVNPGTGFYLDPDLVVVRDLEVPSGGGIGSARAISRAYGAFADGGGELGLRAETLAELSAPATPSRHGFHDECFGGPAKFSLGFMQPSESIAFGHPGAFGAPGAGGSMGYADPEFGIGYGYVTNRMGTELTGDPRDVALRAALDRIIA